MSEDWDIRIGEYTICAPYSNNPDKVAIYHASGEGGDFDKGALAEVIAKFYKENF